MMKLHLEKIDSNNPDFIKIKRMMDGLSHYLYESPSEQDSEWRDCIKEIIAFQDDDGSFKIIDSFKVPSDARVDFCYIPTYICSAILMKTHLQAPGLSDDIEQALIKSLELCCGRQLKGHGYEAFEGQLNALAIFRYGAIREFLSEYPDICPDFYRMIKGLIKDLRSRCETGEFSGPWGENYEQAIRGIVEYFSGWCV